MKYSIGLKGWYYYWHYRHETKMWKGDIHAMTLATIALEIGVLVFAIYAQMLYVVNSVLGSKIASLDLANLSLWHLLVISVIAYVTCMSLARMLFGDLNARRDMVVRCESLLDERGAEYFISTLVAVAVLVCLLVCSIFLFGLTPR